MRRIFSALALFGLVFAVSACDFDTSLEVENTNAPDQTRALSSAIDIEGLVLSGFYDWHRRSERDCYPSWALGVAADHISSSWGNCGMRDISEEPRKAFPNTTGYGYRGVVTSAWYDMYSIISAMNDGLSVANAQPELFEAEDIDVHRMRTLGKLVQALAHSYIGMIYDRAFVFTEDMDLEETEFDLDVCCTYGEVADAAMQMFDEAIALAGQGSFEVPTYVIGAPAILTNQDIAKIANSYSARYMAAAARTPEERNNLDWGEIVRRIDAGITEDFGLALDNADWRGSTTFERTQRLDWMRVDYRATMGPCDTSGAYQAWLATPVADRNHFMMDCPDKRIQGDAVETDGTDFRYRVAQNFRADRGTYHFSRYYSKRWYHIRSTQIGWNPLITLAEMDFLKAEALIRQGRNDEAAALINKTRVARGGLPPATASGVSGPDCVPKKLIDPAGGCADLWETLIWESRVEEFPGPAGLQYFQARGWDVPRGSNNSLLVEGTPYQLPIPANELETLNLPFYTFGGIGGESSAK